MCGQVQGQRAGSKRAQVATVVAAKGALARHGLDRLLHVLGQHGTIRLENDPAVIVQLLQDDQVDLLLADRDLLAAIPRPVLQAAAVRTALVAPVDYLPADVGVAPQQLCTLLSERISEEAALALLDRLLQCRQDPGVSAACAGCTLRGNLAPQSLPLSPREREVFVCIARGMGTSGIATRTGLSVKTIEGYRERIKQKLGLEGREALRQAAADWLAGHHLSLPASPVM